ncbi:MAG: CoA-binding protein, partial [Thermodesulfobacteriota bacterium]|nr:CoA-binding protein [Thermodesulfobacteriota bacterium]
MLKSIQDSPLYLIANPKSIAFFGASNNFANFGSVILASLRSLGYEGAVYPVHPKEDQVQGYKAYPSVLDLPEAPDLALIILPKSAVPQVMEECGQRGVKRAAIVTGGFKEVGGQGVELEKNIQQIAEKYGIRFLGPNCIGVSNPHNKLNPTPFPYTGPPGFIGLASQSGSFITQTFNYIFRLGLGFSTAFSVGNEANIDIVDCLEYLGTCPNTKVIALYIEGITRGREFMETARSIVPRKPIVALYVGGSEAGKRAGFSHTGAMAGPDSLYEGIFRQSGIIRARFMTELFDFCRVLGSLSRPKGDRVAVLTDSGGPGASAADSCGRAGLDVPRFSPETLEKLSHIVPDTGSVNNPVDLTFTKEMNHYY